MVTSREAVTAKIGSTIRELRTGKGLTQAQLALTTFSISCISAVERGKIYPSLRALFFLAKRLGVTPACLLGSGTSNRDWAAGIGYVSPNAQAALESDVALKQAVVQAEARLSPLQSELLTVEQNYTLFLLRGQLALERNDYASAKEQFQRATVQADVLQNNEANCVARILMGNYRQAQEMHRQCLSDMERANLPDPLFAIEVLSNLASDAWQHGRRRTACAGRVKVPIHLYSGWNTLNDERRWHVSRSRVQGI